MPRSIIPQGAMRFTPLADIFIGAIACLLILIIVARQAQESTTHVPQADLVLVCKAVATSDETASTDIRPVILASAEMAITTASVQTASLEQTLRQASLPTRLTLRVAVKADPKHEHCVRQVQQLVNHLNRQYETPGIRNRPRSYLLLDVNYTVTPSSTPERNAGTSPDEK